MAASEPSQPAAPAESEVTESSIKITWSHPADNGTPITSYNVFMAQCDPCVDVSDFSSIGTHTITDIALTPEFTATGLTRSATYKFRVQAVNYVGDSTISDASASILVAVVPDPPINLSIVYQTTSSLKISWTEPDDNGGDEISNYLIQLCIGSDDPCTPFTTITDTITVTTLELSGLVEGETYQF